MMSATLLYISPKFAKSSNESTPDSASPAPEVLKAVVRASQNNAGIHGASLASIDWRSDSPYSSVRRPRKGNVGEALSDCQIPRRSIGRCHHHEPCKG
jgi:hypothetical protein